MNQLTTYRVKPRKSTNKNSPSMELLTLDRNLSYWFIENIKILKSTKTTFNDTIRMERLVSVVRSEAKKHLSTSKKTIYFMQPVSDVQRKKLEI